MKELVGLRLVTNLHCNNNCNFCYQKDKSVKVLNLRQTTVDLSSYYYKYFQYCTIMGGESTLLPNLAEYVRIGSTYAKETRLTTNGKLLSTAMIAELKGAGLNGINVSIATINNAQYKIIHGTDIGLGNLQHVIRMNQDVMDFRINIPLCKENCENNFKSLKETLEMFVVDSGLNVTMCEDIKGSYSLFDNFDMIGATVKEVTNYGLILLDYKGKQIGYYTHKNSDYNDTDLVVTPLGTFINWEGYCQAVGMNT